MFNKYKTPTPIPNPHALIDNIKKVLNPAVKDFLFNPTIKEVDNKPRDIKAETISKPITTTAMPMPIQTKTKITATKAKNKSPGEKSSFLKSFSEIRFAEST